MTSLWLEALDNFLHVYDTLAMYVFQVKKCLDSTKEHHFHMSLDEFQSLMSFSHFHDIQRRYAACIVFRSPFVTEWNDIFSFIPKKTKKISKNSSLCKIIKSCSNLVLPYTYISINMFLWYITIIIWSNKVNILYSMYIYRINILK